MNGIHLLVCGYFTILLAIAGLHMESVFNVLFGLFLASLVVFMLLVNKHQQSLKITDQIVKYGWDGIKYITLSGVFWILTENLCTHIWFIKYLFGHVWWHVFVSYGGYLVSLVPNYLTLKYELHKTDDSTIELGDLYKTDKSDEINIRYDCFGLPYICKSK